MRVYDQDWLSSLEPGITAAKDRLSAARRRAAAAHEQMDAACDEWERHPYLETAQDAMCDATQELDDALEELTNATAQGQEWTLFDAPPTKPRIRWEL